MVQQRFTLVVGHLAPGQLWSCLFFVVFMCLFLFHPTVSLHCGILVSVFFKLIMSVYWLSCLILFVLFLIILLFVPIYCRMTRLLKKQHPKIKVGMQLNQIMMMIKLKVDAQFTTLFFRSVVHLRCHYRCAIFTWHTA